MMGHRRFAPKLYYQLSLDRLVPENHLLRRIAQVIDFSFVYALARPYYSHTGQPSVDPAVLFKTLPDRPAGQVDALQRLLDEVCAGQGRTALIAGEAGVGKSRRWQRR